LGNLSQSSRLILYMKGGEVEKVSVI